MNWKQRIIELVAVKQMLDERDPTGLWEYRLPSVAATAEQLAAVEGVLGEPLDPMYRNFLEHAGGWPSFWQGVDLFGPEELLGGEHFRHAIEVLSVLDDFIFESAGLSRSDLLPIAASRLDMDVFVMTRCSTFSPGIVVWLAGSEVERWPNFEEFFLAMMDYNRLELQEVQGNAGDD